MLAAAFWRRPLASSEHPAAEPTAAFQTQTGSQPAMSATQAPAAAATVAASSDGIEPAEVGPGAAEAGHHTADAAASGAGLGPQGMTGDNALRTQRDSSEGCNSTEAVQGGSGPEAPAFARTRHGVATASNGLVIAPMPHSASGPDAALNGNGARGRARGSSESSQPLMLRADDIRLLLSCFLKDDYIATHFPPGRTHLSAGFWWPWLCSFVDDFDSASLSLVDEPEVMFRDELDRGLDVVDAAFEFFRHIVALPASLPDISTGDSIAHFETADPDAPVVIAVGNSGYASSLHGLSTWSVDGLDNATRCETDDDGTKRCLFYHGTILDGAANILSKGIDPRFGRTNTDFGRAFYVGDSFDKARLWAQAQRASYSKIFARYSGEKILSTEVEDYLRRARLPVVLVFQYRVGDLGPPEVALVPFGQEWKEYVTINRWNQPRIGRLLYPEWARAPAVLGPVAATRQLYDYMKGKTGSLAEIRAGCCQVGRFGEPMFQLAIRDGSSLVEVEPCNLIPAAEKPVPWDSGGGFDDMRTAPAAAAGGTARSVIEPPPEAAAASSAGLAPVSAPGPAAAAASEYSRRGSGLPRRGGAPSGALPLGMTGDLN